MTDLELEAQEYLKSLALKDSAPTNSSLIGDTENNFNNQIIKSANELLIDRLENADGSLRIQDIISAKAEAFKQKRILEGKTDEGPTLIPSVINIQVINNN